MSATPRAPALYGRPTRLRRLRLATCFFLIDDFLAALPVDFLPEFFAETAWLFLPAAFFFDLACAVIEAPTQRTKSITTAIIPIARATAGKFLLIFFHPYSETYLGALF